MRARLIANPGAGTDRAAALLPLANERLRTIAGTLDITLTIDAHDAEHAAARAARDGCDALFVAGGDGTINRVLRGLRSAGLPAPVPIGIIPTGTGNDLARTLGLPQEPEDALDVLVEGRIVDVDVGCVNDHPFVNASAGGFVADVSQTVTDDLKDVAGKLAYLIGGARALLDSEPFRIVTSDAGDEMPADLRMFAVCNGRFIGGGRPIAPEAVLDDGLLDVLVVPGMPTLEFLRALQRIGAGEAADHDGLRHMRVPSLEFAFDRPVRINTDGEVLETGRARYRVEARVSVSTLSDGHPVTESDGWERPVQHWTAAWTRGVRLSHWLPPGRRG
jgi:diacylglycerol kinase (ATP)